jgi:transcriptional regulator with XRE-family HTH domain
MSAIASYLRSHRLKSGFSRRELAEIAGLLTETQVARHERSNMLPSLMAALSYQAIFRTPITELFPGLYETIAQGIEERLSALEHALENSSARGSKANIIAIKLLWLNERKGSTITDSNE